MLPEIASSPDDRPLRGQPYIPPQDEYDDDEWQPSYKKWHPRHDEMRALVAQVLLIERETRVANDADTRERPLLMNQDAELIARFEGNFLADSETAYAQLDAMLDPLKCVPLFRVEDGKHVVYVASGRIMAKPRPWLINLVLLLGTLFSVLIVGMQMALNEIADVDRQLALQLLNNGFAELWRGYPYALSILLILGAHELGHYFAARYHKIAVTLPYFIPAPFISLLGTFGAFIQLRQPIRNRKVLMDIGAAGPLMGLVFAIPIVFIGLATSQVKPMTGAGIVEGNSLLYALAKTIIFGEFLPNGFEDVFVNQIAWAGWTGLLVTGLNLVPVGQLDGGHILYALLGKRARMFYLPLIGGLLLLTIFVTDIWFFWLLLLLFFGRVYAAPLDQITRLDKRRRWIGMLGLCVFLVTFVPVPFTTAEAAAPLPGGGSSVLLPIAVGMTLLWTLRRRA